MFHFHHHRHRDEDCADRRHARGDFWPERGRGGHHGEGHHGMGRGGRLGRLFEHGDLRHVILHLIAERPRHGYEIIKAIEEMAGGTYSPSPGTIYPALTMLEELGFITVAPGEGNKKLHSITAEGAAHLEANRGSVEALLARVREVSTHAAAHAAPQIVRAVQNFRLALQLRMARGNLSAEQITEVAAILDRAAGEIERI